MAKKKKQSTRQTDTKQRANAKGIVFECLDTDKTVDGEYVTNTYQRIGFIKSPVEPRLRPLIMATKWVWGIEFLAFYPGEKQPEKLMVKISSPSSFHELVPILNQFSEELLEDHPEAERYGWRAIIQG